MKTARLLLVEDDSLLASLLTDWIKRHPNWEIAAHARDGREALRMAAEQPFDLILLDISLPGMDGFSVVRELAADKKHPPIIMLTCHSDPFTIQRVHELKVAGYINKVSSLEVLDRAIETVLNGGKFFDEIYLQSASSLNQPESFHKILSDREIEILGLVANGDSDEVIATSLGISRFTVSTHRRNIRAKLGAHSDRDLMQYARRWGIRVDETALHADPSPM